MIIQANRFKQLCFSIQTEINIKSRQENYIILGDNYIIPRIF